MAIVRGVAILLSYLDLFHFKKSRVKVYDSKTLLRTFPTECTTSIIFIYIDGGVH